MAKYEPCYLCGKKPKAYKEDDTWYLDHGCETGQAGSRYIASDSLGNVAYGWNHEVEKMRAMHRQTVANIGKEKWRDR